MIECDSCGNAIVQPNAHERRYRYVDVTIPAEEPEAFRDVSGELCVECRRKIASMIEDKDHSDVRVDVTELNNTIKTLRRQANRFEGIADELEELKEGK